MGEVTPMYSIVMRVYEFDVNVNPTLCHRKPLDSLQSVMGYSSSSHQFGEGGKRF